MLHCHQWLEVTNPSGRQSPFGRTPDAALALHCGPVLLGQAPIPDDCKRHGSQFAAF